MAVNDHAGLDVVADPLGQRDPFAVAAEADEFVHSQTGKIIYLDRIVIETQPANFMNRVTSIGFVLAMQLIIPAASAVTIRLSPHAADFIGENDDERIGFSYTMLLDFDSPPGPGSQFFPTSGEFIVNGVHSSLSSGQLAETYLSISNGSSPDYLEMIFQFSIPENTGSSFVRGSIYLNWVGPLGVEVPQIGTPGPEDLVWFSDSVNTNPTTAGFPDLPELYTGEGPGEIWFNLYNGGGGPGEVTIVPEPSAILLAALGFGGLLRRHRR